MHMADALLSPPVGAAFWIAGGALIGYSAKKIAEEKDHAKTPLMGVMGAFVFAAQMISFSIPGTGSSGHLGGGLLLAVLLGPHRAFLTLSSVLVIQSLFFADGGLLALGSNIVNLAFFPAFIAFPLLFRGIAGNFSSPARVAAASIVAAVAGMLMGALSVVLQTVASGISELPLNTFAFFMLPIHLAIGTIEGLVTWGVLGFITRTEPALLVPATAPRKPRLFVPAFIIAALVTGGIISRFASSHPDGLEWSIAKVTGTEEVNRTPATARDVLASVQQRLSFLPDYSFRNTGADHDDGGSGRLGTSTSGIVGSLLVLVLAGLAGFAVRTRTARSKADA